MKYLIFIYMSLFLTNANSQQMTRPADQPVELGKVSWYRNYAEALSVAKKLNKPMLLLFQEVPGCATCKNYGSNVLSEPMIVEAIENEFVPLLIHNNKKGEDARILKKFGEPSWNNPVVRIIDQHEIELVSRLAGNYTTLGLYTAMSLALQSAGNPIPAYMRLFGEELHAEGKARQTYFKMYCFWSGEAHLGAADGVVATEPGFMGGHEVVKVKYDPDIISESALIAYAREANCTFIKDKGNFRSDKDPQYYLKQSNYKYLPLTPLQRSRINSALGKGKLPVELLSPKQSIWFGSLNSGKAKKEILYEHDFAKAWERKIKESKA